MWKHINKKRGKKTWNAGDIKLENRNNKIKLDVDLLLKIEILKVAKQSARILVAI